MFYLTEAEMMFIPIITGIVSVFKEAGLESKFAPLISLCLGVILCLVFSTEVSLSGKILKGIVLGLSASGFYTNGKNLLGRVKTNDEIKDIQKDNSKNKR